MAQRRLILAHTRPTPADSTATAARALPSGSETEPQGSDGVDLTEVFAAVRDRCAVPTEFPAEVLREAEHVARSEHLADRTDMTDLPFVTIDPVGSMDLDQAMHLQRQRSGYLVRYAIADVPVFVTPGGAVDSEARRRGETIYLPDGSAPLHPPALSEKAASLLPGQERPAFVWEFHLDSEGRTESASVTRARIRSSARLDYPAVQHALDSGTADPMLHLLAEIGRHRTHQERERGGASLTRPDQEIVPTPDGYRLRFRPPTPAEEWNAQISLLTGMAAAELMLNAGVGILRTMPAPQQDRIDTFRSHAAALDVPWTEGQPYGAFLRELDRDDPRHLALMHAATRLFRGADYTAFDGTPPDRRDHAALAAPYAHVTAPLRRLVDRFGLLVCAAACAGQEVPQWVREALPALPEIMRRSGRLSGAVERACTDVVEAATLASGGDRIWEAVVVDSRGADGCTVQITEPAVIVQCAQPAAAGSRVQVRLVDVDVPEGRVVLELVGEGHPGVSS